MANEVDRDDEYERRVYIEGDERIEVGIRAPNSEGYLVEYVSIPPEEEKSELQERVRKAKQKLKKRIESDAKSTSSDYRIK